MCYSTDMLPASYSIVLFNVISVDQHAASVDQHTVSNDRHAGIIDQHAGSVDQHAGAQSDVAHYNQTYDSSGLKISKDKHSNRMTTIW